MPEKIKIETVKDPRDWSSEDGKINLTFYTLTILKANGDKEEVDHSRKQGFPPPQPGEELEVEFEPGKFRPKMKKAKQAFSGGKKEWQPETQRDPERSARILRQHSQSAALAYAVATKFFDGLSEANTQTDPRTGVPDSFWRLVDQFDQDVIQAAKQGADK